MSTRQQQEQIRNEQLNEFFTSLHSTSIGGYAFINENDSTADAQMQTQATQKQDGSQPTSSQKK